MSGEKTASDIKSFIYIETSGCYLFNNTLRNFSSMIHITYYSAFTSIRKMIRVFLSILFLFDECDRQNEHKTRPEPMALDMGISRLSRRSLTLLYLYFHIAVFSNQLPGYSHLLGV